MSNKGRRRFKAMQLQFGVSLVMWFYVGGQSWRIAELLVTLVVTLAFPYAFTKTRICPLEIMVGVPVPRWPKAFRLMYKRRAFEMMCIYFGCAALVILRAAALLFLGVQWLRGLIH
jgi:hypothetical protein